MTRFRVVALLATLAFAGCGKKKTTVDELPEPPPVPEYVTTGNEVLTAIRNLDVEAILGLLNEANQAKIDGRAAASLLRHLDTLVLDAIAVQQVRQGPPHMPEGTVLAKIRADEDEGEVFVLALSFENETYLFDDLLSPSTTQYEALEQIWP